MDELAPLYRSLVEAAFDALVITRAADVVYANPAFAAMSGFRMDEIIGAPVLEFVAPECREMVRERMRSGDEARYEAAGLHKDGRRIPVEVVARSCTFAGAPARLTAIRDVSEARRVHDELRRSEERFRKLIEAHPDMVLVHRDSVIVYANPVLLRYLGCTDLAQMVGRSTLELVHPDDRARATERVRRLHVGELAPMATFRHLREDGSVGVVEVVSVPIDYDGRPATLAIARDVQARRALEQRLIEAEMMASIGLLAAAVNHEINNPLSYVAMARDSLATGLARLRTAIEHGRTDEASRLLDGLSAAADELGEGISRVMTVARDFKTLTGVHAERLEAIDVCTLVPSAARIARAELQSRAQVELALAPVPPVRANAGRLGQVILNLLVNAVQAPPSSGVHLIRVSTRSDADHVLIDVDDNGPGIPAAFAGRVFEPFFSTKPGGQGSGLGLTIARGLVESFGGTLELAASQLGGARFRIRLPALHDPEA